MAVVEVPHKEEKNGYKYNSKYTFDGFPCEWYQCPFDTKKEAEEFAEAVKTLKIDVLLTPGSFGEGKEPEIESARNSAIAPEATLEQLQSKEWLLARLPALMAEFKKDMEELGFIY